MSKCINCQHCIMDDIWGECKCTARQIRIYSMEKYADCEYFKEKEKEKKNENSSNTHD